MKITVTGIGPGKDGGMTFQAVEAIREAEVVVGYDVYVDLVRHFCQGKEVLSTGMRREVDRCRMALEAALQGKRVAFVCSGDAGVYGMAGIMHEVASDHPEVRIEVVPGVTAASFSAALLGAPLGHDFAVVSLSDLLTPWELIEKRVRLAAEADFILCLYNPRSKKRRDYLDKAVSFVLEHRAADTPSGYVKNAGREGEEAHICRLEDIPKQDIDMFTTVIIGNSQTRIVNGKLVTPRGYRGFES